MSTKIATVEACQSDLSNQLSNLDDKIIRLEKDPVTINSGDKYMTARRTIRIHPAIGEKSPQEQLHEFLVEKLKFPHNVASTMKPESIRLRPSRQRVQERDGPNEEQKFFLSVIFPTSADRDLILANSYRLPNGCKVAIEVPDFLVRRKIKLEKKGYEIRQSNEGSRTRIVFEEENRDIKLQSRSPGSDFWQDVQEENSTE